MTLPPAAPLVPVLPPTASPPRDGGWAILPLAAVLLVVESLWVVLALVHGRPWLALAGHAAASAAVAFRVRLRRGDGPDAARRLLATTLPFFGPIAAAGAILQAALAAYFAKSSLPVERWLERLLPGDDDGARGPARAGFASGAGPDREIAPFAEVMIAGTREQKQALLTLAGRDFEPVFAPALQQALHDGNPAVRVQAAATIAKVEADLHDRELALEKAVREHGTEGAAARDLAHLHEMRSRLAWQDAGIRDEHRRHALRLYLECLRRRPDDAGIRLAVGILLRETGRAGESVEWLERDIRAGTASAGAVFACMESLFAQRRFEDVRRLARDHYERMSQAPDLTPEALRVVEYWRAKGLLAPPGGPEP